MAERLPVPLREATEAPERQARQFAQVPVVAIYDSPLVTRGFEATFRVRILDGTGEFTVHAVTEESTALEEEGDFEPIDADYTFIDEGEITVVTGGDIDLADEFFVHITPVTPMLIVRERGRGRIGNAGCVYTPDEVYEDGVYECN